MTGGAGLSKADWSGERIRRTILVEYLGWRRHRAKGRALVAGAPLREQRWDRDFDEATGRRLVNEAEVGIGVLNTMRHAIFDKSSSW